MKEVVYSLIITLAALLGALMMKEKIRYWFWVLFFLGLLVIGLIFDKLEANDSLYQNLSHIEMRTALPNSDIEIKALSEFLEKIECLTPTQKAFYEQKLKERRFDAERTWNNAKNKCWYLPQRNYRDISKNCFGVAMAMMASTTPMSRIIAMLITSLTAYGMSAIDEWYYIEEQLGWCQYHCEMVEFYLTVLEKG